MDLPEREDVKRSSAFTNSVDDLLNSLEEQFAEQLSSPVLNSLPEKDRVFDVILHCQFFAVDIVASVAGLQKSKPGSLVEKMAAAKVIHVLYEFKLACDGWLVREVLALSDQMGAPNRRAQLKEVKRRCSTEFRQIEKWSTVRNLVTGHHDRDAKAMWNALDSIDTVKVMQAAEAQLDYLFNLFDDSPTGSDSDGE